ALKNLESITKDTNFEVKDMRQQIDIIAQDISIIKSQKLCDIDASMINPCELSEPLNSMKSDVTPSIILYLNVTTLNKILSSSLKIIEDYEVFGGA
ncbi:31419_t:CDS:2, partial [Racocetra persica]